MLAQTYRRRVSAISVEQARHNEMPASSAQLPLVAWAGLPSGHVAGVIGQASSCGAWPSTSVLRKSIAVCTLRCLGRYEVWQAAATCSDMQSARDGQLSELSLWHACPAYVHASSTCSHQVLTVWRAASASFSTQQSPAEKTHRHALQPVP